MRPAQSEFAAHLLESFVVGELRKQASWLDDRVRFGHWRTHDQDEVDVLLELGDGRVLGFEVKAGERTRDPDIKASASYATCWATDSSRVWSSTWELALIPMPTVLHVLRVDRLWTDDSGSEYGTTRFSDSWGLVRIHVWAITVTSQNVPASSVSAATGPGGRSRGNVLRVTVYAQPIFCQSPANTMPKSWMLTSLQVSVFLRKLQRADQVGGAQSPPSTVVTVVKAAPSLRTVYQPSQEVANVCPSAGSCL